MQSLTVVLSGKKTQIPSQRKPTPVPTAWGNWDISPDILRTLICSTVVSILTYGYVCWGGNLTNQDKIRLEKIIKKGGGIVGRKQDSFDTLYEKRVGAKKMSDMLLDDTSPLQAEFTSRLNIHSCRYRAPKVCTGRFSFSFAPIDISVLNQQGRGQACFRMIAWDREGEGRRMGREWMLLMVIYFLTVFICQCVKTEWVSGVKYPVLNQESYSVG